ncbi:pseudouridylate synthase, 23S rRNA-/tRNA-specific [Bacteroidales bacterium 6E]|nr:pseudouridylate synthase, 23S rRNA-/tRNA-specific [Bacteroidales bacterium 6E]
MEETFYHQVPEGISHSRLSDYVPGIFALASTKSYVKKSIGKGEWYVNGNRANTGTLVSTGSLIEWRKPVELPSRPYPLKLEIVYEDDFLVIINKPAGLVVSGNRHDTLENAAFGQIKVSSMEDSLPMARAIHRLDSATSGLVILAKTQTTRRLLGDMLERRELEKEYQAIVIGEMVQNGILNEPVQGKEAVTRFVTQRIIPSLVSGKLSLVKLIPETGRTHQLRIHLSQAGFPILGDKLYGDPEFMLKHKGMFLCAVKVNFIHPVTGKAVESQISPPAKFSRFMDGELRRWEKYGKQ